MTSNENARDYFNRLKLAEGFTHGDVDKAKQMLNGSYRNVYVIKGRFKAPNSNQYGVFMLFLCEIEVKLLRKISVVGTAPSIYENSPGEEWPKFLKVLNRNVGQHFLSQDMNTKLQQSFVKVLNENSIPGILKAVNDNSIGSITRAFTKILLKVLNAPDVSCIVDYEKTTSLVLHDFFRPRAEDEEQKPEKSKPAPGTGVGHHQDDEISDEQINEIESEFEEEMIIARPVLSPVKGKYIEEIEQGDEIWVTIHDNSEAATKTATDLNLFRAGKMHATSVTVMKKVKIGHNVVLYCSHLAAFDVVFKILEHGGVRIKLTTDMQNEESEDIEKKSTGSRKWMMLIGIIVSALFITIIVLLVM